MDLFKNSNVNFLKHRRFFIALSLALNLMALVLVFVKKDLNIGIDFAGGTQFTLRFKDEPPLDDLRSVIAGSGIDAGQIQRFGLPEERSVLLRTPLIEGTEEGSIKAVSEALDKRYNTDRGDRVDLNAAGVEKLSEAIGVPVPISADAGVGHPAVEIIHARRTAGIFTSWDQIAGVTGVTPEIRQKLQSSAYLGNYSMLGVGYVGPQVGQELRQKGIWTVVGSLVAMLLYIWIRFELRYGIGAVVASLHDVLVTLLFFTLAGYEFNLTTIAAFLTLIGYSVNDTVVVFDRVRENVRKDRKGSLLELMNLSLNQTLSRTILTGGTTLLASAALWLWGGDSLRGFAFVIVVGVLVGTYSSIYIASPFALIWERWFGDAAKAARQAAAAGPKKAS